jgi:hypothetical protein
MFYITKYINLSAIITSLHNIKYLYFIILFVTIRIKSYLTSIVKFLDFNNLTIKFIVINSYSFYYCDINCNIL